MKKINQFFGKEISKKIVALILSVIFILGLLPILRIGYYAHPSADDFSYGLKAHQTYMETGSLFQAIASAKDTMVETYHTWQGTFSSVFLMALNPAVFSDSIYWLTPFIILGMLFLGLLYFLWILLTEVFAFDKWRSYSFAVLILFASIQNFFWPAQGIYWYNASIHYTFMYGIMLLMLGLQLHSLFVNKKSKYILVIVLSTILSIVVGGGSFPIALVSILLNLCVCIYAGIIHKKWFSGLLIPFGFNIISFFINVLAPGNKVRALNFEQMSPLESIRNAMEYMFVSSAEWFTITILLIAVLSFPIAWQMTKESAYDFRLPGIVTILSFLCLAAMCTPSFYSTSEEPLARVINVVRLMYHLLVFINVLYWCGWLQKKKKVALKPVFSLALLVVVFLLGIVDFKTTEIPQREYITYGAYCSYITGEAQMYHQDYLKRKEILESDDLEVELEVFRVRPFPFWTYDISVNPTDWQNVIVAKWYNKERVVLKQE